jgi:hypothetical protein
VRWTYGPVVFVGLNVQGSNDNYPHAGVDDETRDATEIARQRAEHDAREAANGPLARRELCLREADQGQRRADRLAGRP